MITKNELKLVPIFITTFTMSDFPIGLREVVPDQTVPEKCKEFIINTGTYVMLEKISIKGRNIFAYGS